MNTKDQLKFFLESHKEDFRRWLLAQGDTAGFASTYWKCLVKILNFAFDHGFINRSLTPDVLIRLEIELFALPDLQVKVFPSRGVSLVALRKFVDYLDQKIKEDKINPLKRSVKRSEKNPGELLYQFNSGTHLARTQPVEVIFDSGATFCTNSWVELYKWVVQSLHSQFPWQMRNLLRKAKEKGDFSDFLDTSGCEKFKRTYGISPQRVADNFYLNTNYNAATIVKKIQRWLKACGLDANVLKIYYVKIKEQISKKAPIVNTVKPASPASTYKEPARVDAAADAIREHFPNGFKFDKSTLALLEQETGWKIQSAVIDELQEEMFERKDGVFFLPELIIDHAREEELFGQVDAYLEENASFELQPLYYAYADDLNRSCIRDVGDFEDWLRYFAQQDLKFTSIAKFRIARDSQIIKKDADLIEFLLQKIREAAEKNYGTLEEDDIVKNFGGFSLESLSHIVKTRADDVFVREINETICFQNFEGLGVPGDFSQRLLETLEQIDDLELTPSIEVIHVLLSSNCGRNIRDEFGLEDDRSFRTLIESRYEGKEPRKWKSGVFESKN